MYISVMKRKVFLSFRCRTNVLLHTMGASQCNERIHSLHYYLGIIKLFFQAGLVTRHGILLVLPMLNFFKRFKKKTHFPSSNYIFSLFFWYVRIFCSIRDVSVWKIILYRLFCLFVFDNNQALEGCSQESLFIIINIYLYAYIVFFLIKHKSFSWQVAKQVRGNHQYSMNLVAYSPEFCGDERSCNRSKSLCLNMFRFLAYRDVPFRGFVRNFN